MRWREAWSGFEMSENVGLNIFMQCYGTKGKHKLYIFCDLSPTSELIDFGCWNCSIVFTTKRSELRKELIGVLKSVPMCRVCQKRPMFDPGSKGPGGMICMVCYYDL